MVEDSRPVRQCRCNTRFRRHSDAWREGFRRGAIDALQRAARQLYDVDPYGWAEVIMLCDSYDPHGHEIDLAGGDR